MKYSVRCSLMPNARKDGTHTVRICVSWAAQRVCSYIDNGVDPSQWDHSSMRPKRSQKRALRQIDEITAAVDRLFDVCHLEQRPPSKDEVRIAMGAKQSRSDMDANSMQIAFNRFCRYQEERSGWADHTHQRYETFRRHLLSWNNDMPVSSIDEHAVRSFVSSLYDKGLTNATVAKYYQQMRTFLQWMTDECIITDTSWQKYRPRFKGDTGDKMIIYLTEEELTRLMSVDLSSDESLDHVRDVFLFCCFSGLRYSDVAKMTWEDVHEDHISVITKKTSAPLTIELNATTKAILSKHRSESSRRSDVALPVISNQKYNQYLKELGRLAELNEPVRRVHWVKSERHEEVRPKWQLLTTHCARRTFVVTALKLEIPAEVIMRWTGHTDYKSMRPYVAIVDDLKKKSMAKFDTISNKK